MNADWVNQQIMGWLRDHTREWNTSFWKDISGQEKGLDLTNEQFSIIPWFSITCQVGDNRIPVNDWNSAEYIDLVKVWLAVLARCLTAHTDNSKFIKSVINYIFIASYHSHSETMLQKLQDALSGINSIIHLILTYFMSHSMSKIPEIHSLVHFTKYIGEMGSANNSDSEISEVTHKSFIKNGYGSSSKVNYIQHMLW